jgi:hypothetical protein
MPDKEELLKLTRERFLLELRRHFEGWLRKVSTDLSQSAFELELNGLRSDSVYSSFGLATPEYALVRLMGRISISIGRRLGEIYDKIPRYVTQARFNLDGEAVAPKLGGILELDICVPFSHVSSADRVHVADSVKRHLSGADARSGLAIEIRYNFNPNDSSRLRKDVDMAELVRERNLLGVYLIFSSISPRDEAIARLSRAGWSFLTGNDAAAFMHDLIGMDIASILASDTLRKEVATEMARIMKAVYDSYAVRHTVALYGPSGPA